jgi:hypothetical protein
VRQSKAFSPIARGSVRSGQSSKMPFHALSMPYILSILVWDICNDLSDDCTVQYPNLPFPTLPIGVSFRQFPMTAWVWEFYPEQNCSSSGNRRYFSWTIHAEWWFVTVLPFVRLWCRRW